jgi:hypothetical protein
MDAFRAIALGIVGIGMATALFSPGRTTVAALNAGLTGGQKILYTAESGKLG